MRFAEPDQFLWLWVAAAIAGFLWWSISYKVRRMESFADGKLLPEIASQFSLARNALKAAFLAGVFLFGVLALARPQWGFQWQEIKRQGIDILVAIDTSKSMLTKDVKPNRLERTKLAVKDLVKKLKGDRIGLIAFAGDAFLMCPLTVDYNGFRLALEDLDTNAIPRGGTHVARAIAEAINKYKEVPGKYKALILLTDGENLEGDPVAAAELAHDNDIRIFCVGIGTREGDLIEIANEDGSRSFLKDRDGNYVKSRLNESLLAQIAQTTGGTYVRAAGADFGLERIYDKELAKMEKRDIDNKMEKKYHERFQYPLSLALILLVAEVLVMERKRK